MVLYRKREHFGFDFRLKSFAINWSQLWIMVKLGFPAMIRAACITGTQLILMGDINLFGVYASAAYSIGDKVYHMANIFVTAILSAGGSIIGQNFAAEKYDRIKKVVHTSLVISLIFSAVLSIISLLLPEQIFRLFTAESETMAYAHPIMLICCLIYFLSSLIAAYESFTTGVGNSMLRMISGILDGVVLRIGLSMLFAYGLGMGVIGFFLADGVSRAAPVIMSMIYFYSGIWKKRKKLV